MGNCALEESMEKPESLFGAMRGQFEIVGDIVGPIVDPADWDDEIFPPGYRD